MDNNVEELDVDPTVAYFSMLFDHDIEESLNNIFTLKPDIQFSKPRDDEDEENLHRYIYIFKNTLKIYFH